MCCWHLLPAILPLQVVLMPSSHLNVGIWWLCWQVVPAFPWLQHGSMVRRALTPTPGGWLFSIPRHLEDWVLYILLLLEYSIDLWQLILKTGKTACYQYSRTRRWRKFQKGKIYNAEEHVAIESFVTTLIHWTFFSDDANKVGICWLCRSGQLHVTPSSRWSLPRCHRSVRNDMRLFLRTKQYPVQLRTTKYYSRRYYSSTTKY